MLWPQPWPDQLLRGILVLPKPPLSRMPHSGPGANAAFGRKPHLLSSAPGAPISGLHSLLTCQGRALPSVPSPGHCRPSLNDHPPLCSPASEPAQACGRQLDTSLLSAVLPHPHSLCSTGTSGFLTPKWRRERENLELQRDWGSLLHLSELCDFCPTPGPVGSGHAGSVRTVPPTAQSLSSYLVCLPDPSTLSPGS